jgi:hypothetical protein
MHRSSVLECIEHAFDAVLGIACPIVAVGLAVLGVLGLLGGLFGSYERAFLLAFGVGNLLLALPFAAATWLVRSHEPRLTRWRWLAAIGLLLYCLGFVWPFVDRVWRLMQYEGHASVFHNAWTHSGILLNGGLGVQELGAPFSVCLLLFLLRTLLAHIQPSEANEA